MFNRGISRLLEALPGLDGLDPANVKRLLTSAYLEGLDLASLAEEGERGPLVAQLRRLVTALEVHAVLVPGVGLRTRRACAFVAAESLTLMSGLRESHPSEDPFSAFGSRERYRRVEAALLYLIAAFDANAVMAVRDIGRMSPSSGDEATAEARCGEWALREILSLIRLGVPRDESFPEQRAEGQSDVGDDLDLALRIELWHRIGAAARRHLRWLRLDDDAETSDAVAELRFLGELLETEDGGAFSDLAHLARLLRLACDGMEGRALRRVDPPPGDPTLFIDYVQRRTRVKPLLWPSAETYRDRCLPGPATHAAVAMPTGSGKSGVAELAVAQAIAMGWVLYLAPTRALVSQVRRDLRRALGPAVTVREFLGGAEFTALADETLESDPGATVLVMTPEKCSLALRQSPEAFAALALLVFDECQLLAEPKGRGVLAELVVSQILQRAPGATVLMQSALLENPEDIAAWLVAATSKPCESIRQPWRPTRTLRAVAGFDPPGVELARADATRELLSLPPHRRHLSFRAPLNLLVNLQGAWATDDPADYALARTTLGAPLRASKMDGGVVLDWRGYVNAATGSVAQGLVEAGHRVLAFIPGNKHHNFSVARDVEGFGDQSADGKPAWREIERLLDIADHELGTESVLRSLLRKGVAVHTSAMLQEERRASERAYETGIAKAIFATATLAQGLNLPATAVVIGGIDIGFDPELTQTQREERQQSQLLNAVGRAGRPYVAARSLAVVLPNIAWELGPEDQGHEVRTGAAPFLEQEDASTTIRSQLAPIVEDAIEGRLTVRRLDAEGLAAFAFVPLRSDPDEALGILSRTYAMARRPDASEEDVRTVVDAMIQVGEGLLAAGDGPEWLVDVSYAAGLSLRQIVALWAGIREHQSADFPEVVLGWADLMISVPARMPHDVVGEVLRFKVLDGTKMRALQNEFGTGHQDAWNVMAELLQGWLVGKSLTDLAETAVRDGAAGNSGRGSGNPLPKIIGLSEQLINFGLTRVAGAMTILIEKAAAEEPERGWQLSPAAARSLEIFSLAVRAGCGDEGSLAWWRFGGLRQRRLAHLGARLLPPPEDGFSSDEVARQWMQVRRAELFEPDFLLDDARELSDAERSALIAAALLSGSS